MFKLFPRWFWKLLFFLWIAALVLVGYQAVFESITLWHLLLSILYVWAIWWSGKKLGWINIPSKSPMNRNKKD
jgi:hypothetical protein